MTDLDADLERAVRAAAAVVFATGTEVEVLTRYEPHWASGFEIASVSDDDRFLLRRHSDGAVLPALFGANRLRPRR